MAWGEGHEEGNIRRNLDEIKEEIKFSNYIQTMNTPTYTNSNTGSDAGAGGAILFLLLILAFPGVAIAYMLGAGDGDGIVSIIVNLCMGFYGLVWGIFLWSLKNPITLLIIGVPMIAFAGCILTVCFFVIKDWLENVMWSFRRRRR